MFREWLTGVRLRLKALFHRERLERDLEDELAFHLAMKAEKDGGPAAAARRAFGNETRFREICRELWSLGRLEVWWRDVRIAARALRRSPVFTAVAAGSLALGIGANTAIFSLVNAVMLKSLPVPSPHELRIINWTASEFSVAMFSGNIHRDRSGGGVSGNFPYSLYRDFRDNVRGFSDLFAFASVNNVTARHRGQTFVMDGLLCTGNLFQGLGVTPLIGRTLLPEDEQPDAPRVAVATYGWWERFSGLDPDVLGETVTLNGSAFTLVGVLPRDFTGIARFTRTEFFVPISAGPLLRSGVPATAGGARTPEPELWWVEIMGRLAPGANEAQGRAALEVLFQRMLSAAGTKTKLTRPAIELTSGHAGPFGPRRQFAEAMNILLGLTGLVLLIACVNLAGLFLARGAARQHELAIRRAIGAGRLRLIRQSLTESLVVAAAGGAIGFALATLGRTALFNFLVPGDEPPRLDLATDARVLAFAAGVSILAAFLFGLAPAIRASRANPAEGLREGPARGAPRLRFGKVLIVAQVALTLVLLVGAGLFARSLSNVWRIDPGFDPDSLLVFRLDPSQAGYAEKRLVDFYDGASESIAAIPGVRDVSFSNTRLVSGSMSIGGFTIPGLTPKAGEQWQAHHLRVGDSFFSTMGIPLLLGREFARSDSESAPKVAVVNESFVRMFMPNEHPIGRNVVMGTSEFRIVGVCGDAKYSDLTSPAPATIYFPFRQNSRFLRGMHFAVRTAVPPESVVGAVRRAVAGHDSSVPISQVATQARTIDLSVARFRTFAVLCAAFAQLALLLSAIGLYGVLAYNVERRTREMGIRLALGARAADVSRIVWRDALTLALAGTAAGVPAVYAGGRLIHSYLFGVESTDPLTVAAAALLLLSIAGLAAWIPARRAAALEPMTILRQE